MNERFRQEFDGPLPKDLDEDPHKSVDRVLSGEDPTSTVASDSVEQALKEKAERKRDEEMGYYDTGA